MAEKPFALRAADQTHLAAITTRGRSAARTMKRASYLQAGLQVLDGKPRSGRPVRLAGQRAQFTALACGTPPEGRARWTLRLLADQAVELGYGGCLSHTGVRQILKNELPTHLKKTWCLGTLDALSL